MAEKKQTDLTGISSILGIIVGTIITSQIWSLEQFANSPRIITSIGIWMIICLICFGAVLFILQLFNK